MLPVVIFTMAVAAVPRVHRMQNLMEPSERLHDVYPGNILIFQVRKTKVLKHELICPKSQSSQVAQL